MADTVGKKGRTNHSQASVNEVHLWELALYISEARLRSVVAAVGKSVEALRKYLRK
jgi:hypothetical protein